MNSHDFALQMDQADVLKSFRNQFFHNPSEIYLDGNSLGKLPLKTQEIIQNTLNEQWGHSLISSWNKNWLALPKRISDKFARLLNTNPKEIIIGESTSVRLYQLVFSLLNSKRFPLNIVTDHLQFPSDRYILEGLANQFNLKGVTVIDYGQEIFADEEQLKQSISQKPGIYCLSLVTYKSSYRYNLLELNQWAAKYNSIIVWDFSHAVGALEIDCKTTKTLLAVGCTYKYMNGGPGAPAFLYIHETLLPYLSNPIQGWFGHNTPFLFADFYESAKGIERFGIGTPPILSLQAIEVGVDIILKAGIRNLEQKSHALGAYFISLIEELIHTTPFCIESPTAAQQRGSHVSLSHPKAWQICQALQDQTIGDKKIIPDFRPPHFIRFGITPLYTSYSDLWETAQQLVLIESQKVYENYPTDYSSVP